MLSVKTLIIIPALILIIARIKSKNMYKPGLTFNKLLAGIILFSTTEERVAAQFPDYPEMKIIVFSDPHYFDPSLGTDGKAFQDYLEKDRKLLRESRELLEVAIADIEKSDADLILIPGDLTKDGENINHERMAEYLTKIEASGKKVFVVPGNHDINNPHSFKYAGDKSERVPAITPEEFTENYSAFGYDEALMRDPSSLSYVVEPIAGLWIFAFDACRYRDNPPDGHPITEGQFSKETMEWIEAALQKADDQNKSVLVMMHHGVLEHYKDQKKLYGEYVVNGYKKVSALLAKYGARIVFTGHYHSQDIVMKHFRNDGFLIDIETGSLVTYPCPYRRVSISKNQMLVVESHFIDSIPSRSDFREFSKNYVHKGISGIAANTLIGMKVDSTESWSLSGQVADAFIAHYKGDEVTPEKPFNMEGISFKGKLLIGFKRNLVKSLHHDLEPADNFFEISLK